MGLRTRVLAGLMVLVFVAIASTGWLTLQATREGLEGAESERAVTVGQAVANVLGQSVDQRIGPGAGADAADRDRVRATTATLVGVGGIRDVTVLDAAGRLLAGELPAGLDGEPDLRAALAGAAAITRRSGGALAVIAPMRRDGALVGAVRLRLDTFEPVDDAVRGSTRLLLALTLVDGGLILLFGALFLRGVVRPLEALTRAAERVAAGDLDVPPVEASVGGELRALAGAFDRMTSALRDQKLRLAAQQEQLLAQEKLATVGRLAAGVAHEIGNPLTAVLGYVELLLGEERDPASRDLLQRVRGETGRIHGIVHDLLDYARPNADAIEPVSLRDTVAAAIDLVRPQPRLRNVTVDNEVPAALPPAAASAPRLVQVVLNLLLNAADATAGAGRILVEGRAESGPAAARVIVEVQDDGPGVPDADRARVFDPFFTTKEPGHGTGLGLAVCRSIVQAWGGSIDLVPSPRGARFRVTLPAFAGR